MPAWLGCGFGLQLSVRRKLLAFCIHWATILHKHSYLDQRKCCAIAMGLRHRSSTRPRQQHTFTQDFICSPQFIKLDFVGSLFLSDITALSWVNRCLFIHVSPVAVLHSTTSFKKNITFSSILVCPVVLAGFVCQLDKRQSHQRERSLS